MDAEAAIAAGMVLAAGRGTRMAPLTLRLPKPLVPVLGRTMLDRALDPLIAAGLTRIVVNVHHLADQIATHLCARRFPEGLTCVLSHEDELLEIGGGILKALPLLQPGPFYAVNGDICWEEGSEPVLSRLAAGFAPERMDALLLLVPRHAAIGYDGKGDFLMDGDGRLAHRGGAGEAPFVFAGVQLLSAGLFAGAAGGRFPLLPLFLKAAAAGRLFGIVHDGLWCHVGTPADIAVAEAQMTRYRIGRAAPR